MNILITGATGFIGQFLVKELERSGHNLFFTTRKTNSSENSLYTETPDIGTFIEFFKKHQIEGIIHLASLFLVTHNHTQVSDLIQSNITFPTKILEAASATNVKWFLNTGTFWQHFNNEDYNPVNLYAATKEAFENIIKFYAETTNIKFLTLELSDTFGPGDTRAKIFNKWLNTTTGSPEIDMSPGDQEIDILYISDIISAYMISIGRLNLKTDSLVEKFSLSSSRVYSLRQLSEIFSQTFKKELKIHWGKLPYRSREVMKTWNRGKNLPGWKPKYTFKDGCEKIYSETHPNS